MCIMDSTTGSKQLAQIFMISGRQNLTFQYLLTGIISKR